MPDVQSTADGSCPASRPVLDGHQKEKTHVTLKALADALRERNEHLEREVENRTREMVMIQDMTILAMASLAETRDNETGNHICRTQRYVSARAQDLRAHPRFSHYLSECNISILYKSAPLQDIGKVGIPNRILLKPGLLDPEEFEIMKTHTSIDRMALADVYDALISRHVYKEPMPHDAALANLLDGKVLTG